MGRLLAVFTLCTILLQVSSHGYGQAMKVDDDKQVIRLASAQRDDDVKFVRHPSAGVNASMMLFFNVEELRLGNRIPFLFPRLKRAPNFISRERADSIPFSLRKYQQLLRFFSIPPGTDPAEAMRMTLIRCESPPMQGETKFCPTSKESMFDFVRGAFVGFGSSDDFKVLGTTHLITEPPITSREDAQNYNIISFKEYSALRAVGCHTTAYPYAVYYCHHFEGGAKVFMTQLEGDEDGERVETAVLCHMDTSTWGADHAAFLVLGTRPGTPVCHIFPEYDLVFIPDHVGN